MQRYKELIALVEKLKPKNILEIGTWNGDRALELCQWGAFYTGFDLFEDANKDTDRAEKNVKPHFSLEEVSKKLKNINAVLIKGNTNITLPEYTGSKFDFAFIDGGHSVETIQNDWNNVRELMLPNSVVVFDDYYEGMSEEGLKLWGANSVIKDLDYTLSVSRDRVYGGGFVRLALVQV